MKKFNGTGIDIAGVTNLYSMFDGCPGLKTVDLTGVSFNSIVDTAFMFNGCSSLQTVTGLENADFSNVTTMKAMFQGSHYYKAYQ
ncbi:BspA family leucine-rich repeat surface protein [Enterococcus faecalis]|uniref:BspA family leucine-rich repeat surface protein n=1 Tax=Enterococcus faecalis TaxID=1351 RepID=UPI002FBEB9AF